VLFSFGTEHKRHFLQDFMPMGLDRRVEFSVIMPTW